MTTLHEAARALLEMFEGGPQHIVDAVMLRNTSPEIAALRAALSSDDGMVRVPREPSEAMIDAAFAATVWPDLGRATSSDVIASLRASLRENMRKEYRAMVAAAEKETK